jgi:signal transduction histidine kinase
MTERRSVYFAFQGLFSAVLILLFLYQDRGDSDWVFRLSVLLAMMAGSLTALRLVSAEILGRWWFQVVLFLGDAAVASLLLRWTHLINELYLLYFLIIFGTAITRNFRQSIVVASVTSLLYLFSAWHPLNGFPHETAFWLRFLFLVISASLMAILSLDSQQAQASQERKYRDRLIQVERLATLGQMAGEVAHQIKAPLTTIMVNAEVLLARHAKSKEMVRELNEIRDEVEHCKQILKSLLDLGRIEEVELERIDLREPLRLALKSADALARKRRLSLKTSGLETSRPVNGDQSLLQEALSALLQNAVEASREGGEVRLSVEDEPRYAWDAPGAGYWRVIIEDDGAGMTEEALSRVFEPFFTTKGKEGTGLGLSAAARILQKHGGSIDVYSAGRGRGARFTVTLPRRA